MNKPGNTLSVGRLLSPASIALLYVALAVVWILFSGALLALAVDDPIVQRRIEFGKGLLFVFVTGFLLYMILRTWKARGAVAEDDLDGTPLELRWRVAAGLILFCIVPLGGFLVVKLQAPQVEQAAFSNLEAIADLKVGQVRKWLDERFNDGEVIMASPGLSEMAAALQGPEATRQLADSLRLHLMAVVGSLQYESVVLLDAHGRPLIKIGSHEVPSETLALLPEALASGLTRFADVVRDGDGEQHIDLVVPLHRFAQGTRHDVGVVILHGNPEQFLFRYLRYWPTASASGETVLFKRTGDATVVLTGRSSVEVSPYDTTVPDSLFKRTAEGGETAGWVARGRDHHGVQALAAFRPVAGTDWVLAAKIDRDEVMAPLHDLAFWVSLVTLLAIAVVGAVVLMLWRQRIRTHRLELEAQSSRLMQQFYELPFIGIAVTSPETRRWVQCNDRLCEIMGYSREEILGLSWQDLTHPDDMTLSVAENERALRGESDGFTMDKRFVRKDGTVIHASVDVRCVRDADGRPEYLLAMIHDISERKAAEARIRRLTQTYAALSECNQLIVRCGREEDLFPGICRIAVELGGMKMAWIGMVDPATRAVRPVASFGEGTEWLDGIQVSCDENSAFGGGATGAAIRERRPLWIDDFLHAPMTTPWHDRAAKAGWLASCALPLERDGETVGAFMLYAGVLGAFDGEQRDLLVEMATDISFALTNFAREKARRAAEARADRLAHMYAALSECNQAIVRCTNVEELFPLICRFAVLHGGMKMAWIGWLDRDTRFVRPVASFGNGVEYLQDVTISVDDRSPFGLGAMGTAMRERRISVVQDYLSDARTAPWRERAVTAGWGGAAAVPLVCQGEIVGGLALLAAEPDAFDDEICKLLAEMGLDISFALDLFAREDERRRIEEALRESESRFRDLYEKAPLAYQSLDAAGSILEVNEAWLNLLGRTREEVLGRFVGEFLTEASHATLAAEFPAFQKRGRVDGPVFQFVRSDGEVRLLMVNGRIARDKDGNFQRTHCILSDLTERLRAEEQLRLSAKVFEQGGEGVMITDEQGRIVMVNRAFEDITGYAQQEVVGRNPRLLASGRHDREFFRAMWESINSGGFWQGEVWNRRKDGDVYPEYLSISRVVDGAGTVTHFIGTFNDISESKASQEHIQRLAHYDSLTGLPNRILLADRVSLALSRMERSGEQLALVFLDLDRFKNVNDSLGHRIGDELLVQVASRLKELLRDEDTVSRLGGDEFILVLPGTDADGAAHVAGKVLKALSRPYAIEQHELAITPSMGIAMYPADGDSYEVLSKCADTAMYRAKQGGRQTFRFFTREMQERSDRTLRVENALRRALELDQLRLNFQPQISLESGAVIGVEALLRWHHPELGEVSPADFIPVAEDSGMILPIGEWVLRSAVRQMREWLDKGLPPMVMAVNLSAIQFRQANLPQLVSQILVESGLPPDQLELELTEGVAMENPLEAIEIMGELHARGVRMSIDDFGTGYSSLNYLKRFRVYKLKIDQSFVRDIARDPDDEAIVEAIIGLAASLELQTIAEGVENEVQSDFLRAKGCGEAQGYLYSRPMPAEEFEQFVRENSGNGRG